ncbi:hypothetical protein CEXT_476911 [Caerostris extrusa]|uniref:Uncharacterized protein n=1 Tax=Caerostris extrusa TaxID=172846 RepID=A0AAV4X7H3_CAEEX|nr:hypothetical protein CEXT_476911 [Caerostris extrusa]
MPDTLNPKVKNPLAIRTAVVGHVLCATQAFHSQELWFRRQEKHALLTETYFLRFIYPSLGTKAGNFAAFK